MPFRSAGHDDRPLLGGDLTHAVVERADPEAVNALRFHFLEQVGAERAVHRLVGVRRGLKLNGTCCTSAAGTTALSRPPMIVKNWISPATSNFSAAGSLPAMLLLSGKICASTRPPVSFLNRGPHLRQPLVERAGGGLVVDTA
jgi:hypothetical protein